MIPVFVDVTLGNYNASLASIEKAITKKTKAVFIAHTLGNPFEVSELRKLCDKHDLWLIEDNCDALGSKYDGRLTGTFGHIATCSFYPAHHITMGEGGAVLTDDPILSKIVRSLRDWGRDCVCPTGVDNFCKNRFGWKLGDLPQGYDHKYIYSEIGYNLKITDIQAALGLAQLEKLPGFIQKRKDNFAYLYEAFRKFDKYFILPEWNSKADPSWFGFLLTIRPEAGFKREELMRYLNEKKIGTRLLFAGNITKQPYFKNYPIDYRVAGDLKNTDTVMNDTFWIGVYPGLTEEMLDYVIKSFTEFVKKYE
jgi:CDP-4-dehydro-6-deoxyglucose reductase, E1